MDAVIMSASVLPFSTAIQPLQGKRNKLADEIKKIVGNGMARVGFSVLSYLIKPVYNVGDFGEDIVIPLDQDLLTLQSITPSTSTFARTTETFGAVSAFPVDDHTTLASDKDAIGIAHEGNDTQFSRIYSWRPDMDVVLYKLDVNAAFGLNVSAYTSGNFSLTSVRIKIYTIEANANQRIIFNEVYTSGLGNLTATGSQIFVINEDVLLDTEVYSGFPVIFEITVTSGTGVGTRQEGVLPWFPYQAAALIKSFSRSELRFHCHASVSHADKVLKRQQNDKKLDYGGINVLGKQNNEQDAMITNEQVPEPPIGAKTGV